MNKEDLTGRRFGRLVVQHCLGIVEHRGERRRRWSCICDCGNDLAIPSHRLLNGSVRSCGCLAADMASFLNTKHGGRSLSEYRCWQAMLGRCLKPARKDYRRYGAKGITVCERWLDFAAFYADMGPRPSLRHSLDRFPDPNGNYEPGNVRWATAKEQANNRRNTHHVTYCGETKTISAWAATRGLPYEVLYARLVTHKWPIERAFSAEVRQ